jgi:dynein heavy chain
MEQIEIMEALDRELNKVIRDPSEIDLERYYYYVEKGTDEAMIASLPSNQFEQFSRFIAPSLRDSEQAQHISNDIVEEIKKTYVGSMKKSIVDYVLMNLEERKRLKIEWLPKHFNQK